MGFDGVTRAEDAARIRALESARAVYGWRRVHDLLAAGLDVAQAWAMVNAEIADGAVLQLMPVRVVRSPGDGDAD